MSDGCEVLVFAAGCNLSHRSYGDALVDDGNTVLVLEVLRCFYQVLGSAGYVVVHLVAHAIEILVGASHKGNAHRDGTNVEVLLLNHSTGLCNLCNGNRHGRS